MSRLLLSACLAVALPAAAAAQTAERAAGGPSGGAASAGPAAADATEPGAEAAAACRAEDVPRESANPNWRWRLRAYRALDCVMAVVDEALARTPADATAAGGESNPAVAVAREDLERIRTWAWQARDAAARIGH